MLPERVMGLLFLPLGLSAQAGRTPPPLVDPPAPLGTIHGLRVGEAAQDTGFVAQLPRREVTGRATYAIELDTFDFRRKWTVRLGFPGPDSLEVVLRYGDTVPPQPRSYQLIILATGRSHGRDSIAGSLRAWEGTRWQSFVLGGSRDWVTFGRLQGRSIVGSVAVIGGRLDYSDSPRSGPGRWRYRGVEGSFTAQPGPSPPPPALTAAAEDRLMVRAIDGLMITWSGAENGDGPLEDRTAHGVRDFVLRRWGTTLAVDSVTVSGEDLWIRLRGVHLGRRCAQSTREVRVTCGWAPGARL